MPGAVPSLRKQGWENSSCTINIHFLPQVARLATTAHQLWGDRTPADRAQKTVVVLQQERQEDWFRCFTHAVGAPLAAVMSGWGGTSTVGCDRGNTVYQHPKGQACFWHPPGSSCSAFGQRPFGPMLVHQGGGTGGTGGESHHNTGSASKLDDFYDDAATAHAHRIFEADFALLRYE